MSPIRDITHTEVTDFYYYLLKSYFWNCVHFKNSLNLIRIIIFTNRSRFFMCTSVRMLMNLTQLYAAYATKQFKTLIMHFFSRNQHHEMDKILHIQENVTASNNYLVTHTTSGVPRPLVSVGVKTRHCENINVNHLTYCHTI